LNILQTGIAPATGVSASFPADDFSFIDSQTGLSLDSNSLNTFLDLVTLAGVSVDFNTAMASVECTIVDTDGKDHGFDYLQTPELAGGAAIGIASYQCGIPF
jgi:hypothetical protein